MQNEYRKNIGKSEETKTKNKKEEFLGTLFPNMKTADIRTMAAITSDKEVKDIISKNLETYAIKSRLIYWWTWHIFQV